MGIQRLFKRRAERREGKPAKRGGLSLSDMHPQVAVAVRSTESNRRRARPDR